ncbi:hypothetical protein RKD38_004891 [Streptomyces ambofaciens]
MGAGLAEGGHQGAVADDGQLLAFQPGGDLGPHEVVLDAEDAPPLGADHPAAHHPARVDRRGPVEGRGGGRPPVDDQRGVVLVQDADAADVQGLGDVGGVVGAEGALGGLHGRVRAVRALPAVLAEEQVDAAEQEVLELVVQAVEVDTGPEDLRVALGEGAGRADVAALGGVVHEELRLVDLLLETSVHPVEVRLFHGDLSVPHGVVLRVDRRVLLSLCGHRAPF